MKNQPCGYHHQSLRGFQVSKLIPDTTIGLWNARSLVNKPFFLQSLVSSKSLDIICITETWLTETIPDNEIVPYNFNVFRRDRDTRGGGVLIAKIPSRLSLSCSSIEMIVVEVYLNPRILVACLYIPPNSPETYLNEVISTINALNYSCDLILSGDFNCPDINWSTLTASNQFSKSLCDTVFTNNLVQHVSDPTHRHGNCLDLLFSNCQERINGVTVDHEICNSTSDHHLVSAYIASRVYSNQNKSVMRHLNYAAADFQEMDIRLMNIFSDTVYADNVEVAWSNLKNTIISTCKEIIPSTSAHSHENPPWFNAEIRH